jgi:hypothetical protein
MDKTPQKKEPLLTQVPKDQVKNRARGFLPRKLIFEPISTQNTLQTHLEHQETNLST